MARHSWEGCAVAHSQGEQDDPLIGQWLGEFEIVERAGRSPTGTDYKARQPALDHTVTIHVLDASLAEDEAFLGRFYEANRAAANVHHTYLVQAIGVGEVVGLHYLATEQVTGQGLDSAAERGARLKPMAALRYLKELASEPQDDWVG